MTANLHKRRALRLTDPVDASACQLRLRREIIQPVLEAGRTEIRHEDFHATPVEIRLTQGNCLIAPSSS
ncbi:MAG: hypothetical protein JWN70_3933 [Planctomycetaceae bacterium]|nr:hypothetical protein [Planctomycetaceae bacterium]